VEAARRLPLSGRSILVTRSREQAPSLQSPLEALGAQVTLLPCVEIGPPRDWGELDAAIARLGQCDWIVFTSTNAVAFFCDRLDESGGDVRSLSGTRLAAIGPATGEALRQRGAEPDLVPAEHTQEGLIDAFAEVDVRGAEVLVPASAIGRTLLDERLVERGAAVTRATAYQNRCPSSDSVDIPSGLLDDRLDLLVFASPSSVHHFLELLGQERGMARLRGAELAAIGPTTARALTELDLAVAVQPSESTVPALVEAVCAHYAGPAGGRS